jgi:N-methylhydantoinase B/oxoprolinase/acetone carboxylase alpha subunit
MSEFEVPTEYKVTTLQQRLEALNVEGWHNEEAKLVAISIGNNDEVERLTANIEIIKTAIVDVKARIAELNA